MGCWDGRVWCAMGLAFLVGATGLRVESLRTWQNARGKQQGGGGGIFDCLSIF